MPWMRRVTVAALFSVALAAPPSLRAADTVTLAFAWPAGMQATVSFEGRRVREVGERRIERGVAGQYRISTSKLEDGLLLSFSDFEAQPDPPGAGTGQEAQVQRLLTRLSSVLPDYVVGEDGKLLRVVGVDAMRSALETTLAEAGAEVSPALRERIQKMTQAATTEAQLTRTIAGQWSRDVGAWVGMSLEEGRLYEGSANASTPMLGQAEMPMSIRYRLLERRPCSRGGEERQCVVLEMRALNAEGDSSKILESLSQTLTQRGSGKVQVTRLDIERSVELVTEPDTLVPHEVRSVRRTSMVVVPEGAAAQRTEQSDERVLRYAFDG